MKKLFVMGALGAAVALSACSKKTEDLSAPEQSAAQAAGADANTGAVVPNASATPAASPAGMDSGMSGSTGSTGASGSQTGSNGSAGLNGSTGSMGSSATGSTTGSTSSMEPSSPASGMSGSDPTRPSTDMGAPAGDAAGRATTSSGPTNGSGGR